MLVYLLLELVFSRRDVYDPASLALLTTFGLSSEVSINSGLKIAFVQPTDLLQPLLLTLSTSAFLVFFPKL